MTSNRRTVFDTNVTVSAVLLPRSVPRQAFDLAISRHRLLISSATVFELEEVLRRPKFDRYLTESERLEFLAALVASAETVEVVDAIRECRDPKDDKFLELAISGHASEIVTGDADLLAMHSFRGIAIVTPAAFLQAAR